MPLYRLTDSTCNSLHKTYPIPSNICAGTLPGFVKLCSLQAYNMQRIKLFSRHPEKLLGPCLKLLSLETMSARSTNDLEPHVPCQVPARASPITLRAMQKVRNFLPL